MMHVVSVRYVVRETLTRRTVHYVELAARAANMCSLLMFGGTVNKIQRLEPRRVAQVLAAPYFLALWNRDIFRLLTGSGSANSLA